MINIHWTRVSDYYNELLNKADTKCPNASQHSYQVIENQIVCVHCKDVLLKESVNLPRSARAFMEHLVKEIQELHPDFITVWHNGYHVIGYGACHEIINPEENTIILPYSVKPNGVKVKDYTGAALKTPVRIIHNKRPLFTNLTPMYDWERTSRELCLKAPKTYVNHKFVIEDRQWLRCIYCGERIPTVVELEDIYG